MGRHGDPVAAADPLLLLLQPLYGQQGTPLFGRQSGQVDRIDENLGQRAVEPPPDDGQFAFVLLGERVPKIGLHDLHAVAQTVAEQHEDQVLDHVILEPIRHCGEYARPQPESFQPDSLHGGQFRRFHACRAVRVPRKVSRSRPWCGSSASGRASPGRSAPQGPWASPRTRASYRRACPSRRR